MIRGFRVASFGAIIQSSMVPSFERRRNLHPLNVLISSDPDKAKVEMIRAYKKGGYTHEGAAQVFEVAESTVIRWTHKLDLWKEFDRLRNEAEKNGTVVPSRSPARKRA